MNNRCSHTLAHFPLNRCHTSEQHDQRGRVYGGHNGVSIKNLTNI
jgi:hypothetical protein